MHKKLIIGYDDDDDDKFETIDIDGDGADAESGSLSLLDSLMLDGAYGGRQDADGKKKSIYLSFYTPTTMVNIQHKTYADSAIKCRLFYNVWVFFLNCFISVFKYLMTKSNELTIYVTKDSKYPDYHYSHVELSTEEYTYVAKWGSDFTRIQGKFLSPDKYGSVCVNLSPEDYAIVVEECETAANNRFAFNYVGSVFNFILPRCVKDVVFENGLYEKKDACFCSEFVARALSKTEAFSPLFAQEQLVPAMVSPIKLCILVSKFSEENITGVTASTKMLKKKDTRKKVIVKS